MDTGNLKDARVLLVDDDPAFLRVMSRALERRGLQVSTAECSAQALRLAGESRPDYALVDLKLGEESGLDLIRELHAADPDLVIVVLTGYASIATAVTAVKSGAANYLAKPVRADEVLAALRGPEASPAEDFTPMSVERLQWEHIQRILHDNDGNISATARSLGMYRRTLQRKLAKKPVSG